MNRGLKLVVSAFFGFSAIMKLIDYKNTVIYFANFTSIESENVRYGLAFLIFIEIIIAFSLPLNWPGQRTVQNFTLVILFLFLVINVSMIFKGVKNCGCFGTFLISHPWISSLKNIVLLILIAILKYDSGKQK